MRKLVCAWLVICVATYSASVRADDQAAKAVIDKAVQAIGGAENVGKYKALSWKGKGTFHGLGMPIEFTGEWFVQPPDKMRSQVEADFQGMKLEILTIINDNKGWRSMMGNTSDMEEDALAESKSEMYEGLVDSLLPLEKQPGFKLTALGESKVGDKAAVGVKVSHAGQKDVSLFFDKDTGLLLKSARQAKDPMTMQETQQETFFSDYQDIGGVKRAKKRVVKRDGKDYIEMQVAEYKGAEKLDDKLFAKPAQ